MEEESIESLRKNLEDRHLPVDKKQELRTKLVDLIKEKALVRFDNNEPVEYHITYDTFASTLEPVYFWALDFLRGDDPSGLGFEVDKVAEEFEASSGGGFFGELGSRSTVMQERAMNILGKVNDVLRTIINLIYDLKEFEMRIKAYDDSDSDNKERRQAGEYSLRGIWMDQVDVRTGLGSINQLTRGDLQFVTLRDAFLQAKGTTKDKALKDVNKMDLNRRVKLILKKKLEEYFNWREESGKELRRRYKIEKNYLRSQVDSLKLYTKWVAPYMRAAQKLGMREFKTKAGLPIPDMVTAFDNMQMELKLMGKKKFEPKDAHISYSKLKFDNNYNACVEIQFIYRTAPQVIRQAGQTQHYGHMGTVDILIRAYVFSDKDLEDIYKQEVYEDMELVEHLTNMSLKDLKEDLDEYLKPEDKKEEEEKGKDLFEVIKESVSMFGKPFKKLKIDKILPSGEKKAGKFQEEEVIKATKSKAMNSCYTLYDIFKKAHKMVTW